MLTFILYSPELETGSVPLHIERGRGNRPDEASATCPTDMGVVPNPAEPTISARRMSSERREEMVQLPATALRCRVCETQYPLDPIGVCARCFGPLDPVYDRDEQRRTVTRESITDGPQSIWRYAHLLPVAPLPSSGCPSAGRRSSACPGSRRRSESASSG